MNFQKYKEEDLKLADIAYNFSDEIIVQYLFDEKIEQEQIVKIETLKRENHFFLERLEEFKILFEMYKITSIGYYRRYKTKLYLDFASSFPSKDMEQLPKKEKKIIARKETTYQTKRPKEDAVYFQLTESSVKFQEQAVSNVVTTAKSIHQAKEYLDQKEEEDRIFEEQKKALEERAKRLRKMSFDTDNTDSLNGFENIPLYMRRITHSNKMAHASKLDETQND